MPAQRETPLVADYERAAAGEVLGNAGKYAQWLADNCADEYGQMPSTRDPRWLEVSSIAGLHRLVMTDFIAPALRCAAQDELCRRYLSAMDFVVRKLAQILMDNEQ